VLTGPLPSSGHPIVARICFRGNVFTESLPSNGYTRYSILSYSSKCPGEIRKSTRISLVLAGPCLDGYSRLSLLTTVPQYRLDMSV
jgi:hypothetical protein